MTERWRAMVEARLARPVVPLAERIARRTVVDPSGCWLWTGAHSKKRGGNRPVIKEAGQGRVILVARWQCEQRNGPPPSDKHEAGHTCPAGERADCINPDHLTWMTRVENELYKRGRYRREDSDFS